MSADRITKQEFAEHFQGVLDACGDNYIAANLKTALRRYVKGEPSPEFVIARREEPPHSPSGWPGSDQ